MSKFKVKYDLVLFILLMIFLFVPIIQGRTSLFPVRPLKGVFEPTPTPELTFDNYCSNTYQKQIEQYTSERFGFREPVIRLYNQYLWSAYNKTYCHFIVPGKDGYLYYTSAVNDHFGTELLKHFDSNQEAVDQADKEIRLMNKLRYVLKDYGIEFLAFIAPDKPEIYPEYLPCREIDTTTIHLTEYYTRRMEEEGFPFINMTDWFVNMRDTASFPIFPKTDSHWHYSSIYGFDSLFRFINTLDGEAKFPKIHIGPPMAYKSKEREGDEETLNLIFRIRGDKTRYKSNITVETDSTHRKPKVLFVGDSFIWSMAEFMPIREIMADREVWFYNNTAFEGFDNKTESLTDINRLSHLLNTDYVVFYSAGHQWREATYGFAKDALLQLCVSDSLFDATIRNYTKTMRNKGENAKLTDEEFHSKAIWLLKSDPERIPGLEGEDMPSIRNTEGIAIARCINEIKQDEDWVLDLKTYAFQHSLTIHDALEQEAFHLIHGEPLLRTESVFDSTTFINMKKAELIEKWRQDLVQTRFLQEKAKKLRRPFEAVLEEDAQWVINKQIEEGSLFQ